MVNLKKIEEKWQKEWEEEKIFEVEPDPKKPKFFLTFPYPYVQAPPHLGHAISSLRLDVIARWKRMKGFNVLWPVAFHLTGEPLVGAVKRYKKGVKSQVKTYEEAGIPEEYLDEPIEVGRYFINQWWIPNFKRFGISVDWRRSFYTTSYNPHYDKFVQWQYRKLRKLGYVVKGTHPVIWCPECESPTGDHARLEGEGVSPVEYTLLKFDYKGMKLVAGTLRPETIFGVTNMWINPEAEYVKAKVGDEEWIISRFGLLKLREQLRDVKEIEIFKGEKLVGEHCKEPIKGREIPIYPASLVDPKSATGIVTSVPAHAPIDYIALKNLKEDKETIEKYKLNQEELGSMEPISMIKSEELGECPAMEACNLLNIKSVENEDIKKATKLVYKKEYHTGILKENCEKYSGLTVKEVKEGLVNDLEERGVADKMWETEDTVICRCGTTCLVKILEDQWFLKYSDSKWKKDVKQHLKKIRVVPKEAKSALRSIIDWLENKACARRSGLGTKLPWDPEWIIESLSDSTIYMAFYTISKYINQGLVPAEELDDKIFDYLFLGIGKPSELAKKELDEELLKKMREEFMYWYPVDLRNSGKDLLYNHLVFYLFHHVVIFPKKYWPKQISVNGLLTVEGKPMSKSRGNYVILKEALDEFGADITRMNLALSIKGLDDPNWDKENVMNLKSKLKFILDSVKENLERAVEKEDGVEDRWLKSVLQRRIERVNEYLNEYNLQSSGREILYELQNDLNWYLRRTEKPSQETLRYFYSRWLKMLAPFVPHLCEELWRVLGNKGFISLAKWPEVEEDKINQEAEKAENLVKQTLEDIRKILKVIGISPGRICIYTRGREVNEYKVLQEASDFFKREFSIKKFEVYKFDDPNRYDPKGRAKKAKPLKPAIYVE